MPVRKVKGGYKYGTKGKVYKPKQKQNGRAGPFERIRINESQRNDIMIKLICDKCGKDYTDESLIAKTSLTAPLLPTLFINATNDPRTLYLCDDCMKKVCDFIFSDKSSE